MNVAAAMEYFGVWLVDTSLRAAVLVLLVMVAQRAFRAWLAPRWRYALWLLVVARLLLPVAPASPTSLFNAGRVIGAPAGGIANVVGSASRAAAEPAAAGHGKGTEPSRDVARPRIALHHVLLVLWLAVALALLARLVRGHHRLSRRVCRTRPVTRQAVLDVLEDAKQELAIRVPINVVESEHVASPALLGFVRPRLLVPVGLLDAFATDELRLVFLHELAHLKRHDIALNWLMCLLAVLHWFNPLVWLAYGRMRADRELACDSLVLSFGRAPDRERYGQTMIKFLEFAGSPPLVPGVAGILEDRDQLKRRITMIAQHSGHRYAFSALAASLMAVLAIATFTRAVGAPAAAAAPQALPAEVMSPLNLDFEQGVAPGGAYAANWMGGGDGYELSVDADVKHAGAFAGRIRNLRPGAEGFGTYTGYLKPGTVAGHRVRLSGYLKLEGVTGAVGLWMRADSGGQPAAFDNMLQQQVRGTRDWQPYSIEIEVPSGTDNINFGALLAGGGTLWIDDLKLEVVGDARAPSPAIGAAAGADQDFDFTPALVAIEKWLALSDGFSSDATYDAASTYFQNAVTREDWARSFKGARPALGKLVARTITTKQHATSLPGAPDGEYVVALYQTAFGNKKSAVETCTVMKDRDGQWRVAGYFIR